MSGWWLVSYVALWVLFVAVAALLLGALREISLLRAGPSQKVPAGFPEPSQDGPPAGSVLPPLPLEGARAEPVGDAWLLVSFLSPLCQGCHESVELMNRAVGTSSGHLQAVVILDGSDQAVDAFLRIFPLEAEVIRDPAGDLAEEFSVHFRPFALLYDPSGRLVSKNQIANSHDLDALLAPLGEGASIQGSDTTSRGDLVPASR